MRRVTSFTHWPGAVAIFLVWPAGCRTPIMGADDAVAIPGDKTRLTASLEREAVAVFRKDIEGVRVRFHVDGHEIGDAKTDEDGLATVQRRLDAAAGHFEVRAVVDGQELHAVGRIFAWSKDPVVIAVDIDHTVERTDYDNLLAKDEDGSDPLKRSAQTLRKLADDFQIVYLTGRARFLLDTTRDWLKENHFPPGPVVTAEGVREMLRPGQFKVRKLRDLRKAWPHLLIGIGDQPSDADAYGENEMLTLALAPKKKSPAQFGPHAIVIRDWNAIEQFFDANRATLTNSRALKEAIDGQRMLQRPVARYEKR